MKEAQIEDMVTPHYEQTLEDLADKLVTPERYGKHAVQLVFPEFEDEVA